MYSSCNGSPASVRPFAPEHCALRFHLDVGISSATPVKIDRDRKCRTLNIDSQFAVCSVKYYLSGAGGQVFKVKSYLTRTGGNGNGARYRAEGSLIKSLPSDFQFDPPGLQHLCEPVRAGNRCSVEILVGSLPRNPKKPRDFTCRCLPLISQLRGNRFKNTLDRVTEFGTGLGSGHSDTVAREGCNCTVCHVLYVSLVTGILCQPVR